MVHASAAHLPHVVACQNCSTELVAKANYCPNCGQQALDKRQSVRNLFLNWWDDEIGVDGKLVRTLRLLLTRPGELTRRYAAGQRKAFTDPLRMYFSLVVVYLLVIRDTLKSNAEFNQIREGAQKAGGVMQQWTEAYLKVFTEQFDLVLLVSIPGWAWLTWLNFRRQEPWFANHVIGAFHLYTFTMLTSVATYPLRFIITTTGEAAITLIVTIGYMVMHLKYAYGAPWADTIGRFVLLMVGTMVLMVLTLIVGTILNVVLA